MRVRLAKEAMDLKEAHKQNKKLMRVRVEDKARVNALEKVLEEAN